MSRRIAGLIALSLISMLAVTGIAAAKKPGHRAYGKTFPVASRLCKATAGGHAPKRLKGQEAKVLNACGTLQTAYDGATTTVLGAETTFKAARKAARAQANATCKTAGTTRAQCKAARQQAKATIATDRATLKTAYASFHTSIEGARKAFWGTIHALKGGAAVPADAPATNAAVPGADTVPAS